MLEIMLVFGVVVLMTRIAAFESFSTIIWGASTVLLEIAACFLLPWPFIRVFVGAAAAFGALTAYKIIGKPKQPFS